jgi:RNA polymerase subunit RPABC4/transcription elongation factor Spt4
MTHVQAGRVMARSLVVLFLFVNLILCFYITYQLFRTADYLASAFKIASEVLSLVGMTPPDFSELKALGIYVLLLGISGFALAYWVDEDGSNIKKLLRSRRLSMKSKKQEYAEKEPVELEFLECPECGEELEEGFEICPNCGYELKPISCPKCGKEISRSFNLCPYCGNQLKEEKE